MRKAHDRGRLIRILCIVGFIACSLALLYPVISDRWNRYRDSLMIASYNQGVTDSSVQEKYDAMWDAADGYNRDLAKRTVSVITSMEYRQDGTYESLLNPNGDGMMGYLEIPCIDVTEVIYHYTSDDVLQKGIGHIHGSSLPVGGEATHAVLTGHRGLPSREFFSNLDKVETGDSFYLHILGRTLAYKVTDIRTVQPDEVESLVIEPGRDLVTLVTCTPYGVNTDRLLVTGERIPFDVSNVDENGYITNEEHIPQIEPAIYVFFGFLAFIAFVLLFRALQRRKKQRPAEGENAADAGPEGKNGRDGPEK